MPDVIQNCKTLDAFCQKQCNASFPPYSRDGIGRSLRYASFARVGKATMKYPRQRVPASGSLTGFDDRDFRTRTLNMAVLNSLNAMNVSGGRWRTIARRNLFFFIRFASALVC